MNVHVRFEFCKIALANVILILLILSSDAALAGGRVGIGPNCGVARGDGAWQQDGQLYNYKQCGFNVVAQYENYLTRDLTYRTGLAYRKGTSVVDGEWVTDACYKNPSPPPECALRYNSRYVGDTTRAVTVTIGPEWRFDDMKLSAHIGLSSNRSVTKIEWDSTRGVCATDVCPTGYWRRRNVSALIELSASYRELFATWYYVHSDRGDESAQKSAYGLSIGYKF